MIIRVRLRERLEQIDVLLRDDGGLAPRGGQGLHALEIALDGRSGNFCVGFARMRQFDIQQREVIGRALDGCAAGGRPIGHDQLELAPNCRAIIVRSRLLGVRLPGHRLVALFVHEHGEAEQRRTCGPRRRRIGVGRTQINLPEIHDGGGAFL